VERGGGEVKKIPTVFVRNPDDRRYVTDEITPGCEWVLAGEGVATRKYDGTCVRVENGEAFSVWARREVRPGKATPPGFVEVERDETTGKVVGWEPWSSSSFARFIAEAQITWAEEHPLPDPWRGDPPSGTYELIGPKINGNPEHANEHRLIPHAQAEQLSEFRIDGERTFASIRGTVDVYAKQGYEGIVWHHPDGRMAKLKARDFPKAEQ
jgi:hypothetical protein